MQEPVLIRTLEPFNPWQALFPRQLPSWIVAPSSRFMELHDKSPMHEPMQTVIGPVEAMLEHASVPVQQSLSAQNAKRASRSSILGLASKVKQAYEIGRLKRKSNHEQARKVKSEQTSYCLIAIVAMV